MSARFVRHIACIVLLAAALAAGCDGEETTLSSRLVSTGGENGTAEEACFFPLCVDPDQYVLDGSLLPDRPFHVKLMRIEPATCSPTEIAESEAQETGLTQCTTIFTLDGDAEQDLCLPQLQQDGSNIYCFTTLGHVEWAASRCQVNALPSCFTSQSECLNAQSDPEYLRRAINSEALTSTLQ